MVDKKLKEIFINNNVVYWNNPKITYQFRKLFNKFNEFKGSNDISNLMCTIEKETKFEGIESFFVFMSQCELKSISEESLWDRKTELSNDQKKHISTRGHYMLHAIEIAREKYKEKFKFPKSNPQILGCSCSCANTNVNVNFEKNIKYITDLSGKTLLINQSQKIKEKIKKDFVLNTLNDIQEYKSIILSPELSNYTDNLHKIETIFDMTSNHIPIMFIVDSTEPKLFLLSINEDIKEVLRINGVKNELLIHNSVFPNIQDPVQYSIYISKSFSKCKYIIIPSNNDNFVKVSTLVFYDKFKVKYI